MHKRVASPSPTCKFLIGILLVLPTQSQEIGSSKPSTVNSKLDLNKIVLDRFPPSSINSGGTQVIDPAQCGLPPNSRDGSTAAPWVGPGQPSPPAGATDAASLAGAKVSRIVVKQYQEQGWSQRYRSWPEIQGEIQKVWSGPLDSVNFLWSEIVPWNVFAIIEFEDSPKRGCLVTDGVHVHLRDVNGQAWFWRLPPPKRSENAGRPAL